MLAQPVFRWGREAEVDRIRAFLAARTNGGALLVRGEPGVGKTQSLDAASSAASDDDTRVLHAAGIQFEAELSFSGLNQVLLPLLDLRTELAAVHRDALGRPVATSVATRAVQLRTPRRRGRELDAKAATPVFIQPQ